MTLRSRGNLQLAKLAIKLRGRTGNPTDLRDTNAQKWVFREDCAHKRTCTRMSKKEEDKVWRKRKEQRGVSSPPFLRPLYL